MNIIFQGRFPVRTIVLIGVALLITTQIYAQNAEARLSLTLRNATLKEFVKRIENSTGYSFIYGEEIIIKHKINLQVKDKPLREILDLVFKNEQISYQFTGRHILLQKKKESKTVGRKFTISGYVTDGTSSETLIGTNIIESHQNQGTTTNPYGFYSITLPEGETELRFSYLGYATEAHHFTLSQDTLLNIRMQGNTQLQEVVIVSEHTGRSRCHESHPADAWRTGRSRRFSRTVYTRRQSGPESYSTGWNSCIQRRPHVRILFGFYSGGCQKGNTIQKFLSGTFRRTSFFRH